MDSNFTWLYLLIFLIPLTRVIPRIIRQRRMKKDSTNQTFQKERFESSLHESIQKSPESARPQTKDMLVLGELYRGTRTFESIKKNTGFSNDELNSILEDLEKQDMMRVEQKNGILGSKIEIYATEKGFKKYLS